MDWDDYKDSRGEIDLLKAYQSVYGDDVSLDHDKARSYLGMIETLRPITSRQIAALALATAEALAR